MIWLGRGPGVALDWIARHRLARGQTGWEPYPTSLRLLSWCAWLFGEQRERGRADVALRARVAVDLAPGRMARSPPRDAPARQPSARERGGAALAGACFAGPPARWLRSGLAWLDRELPEQMLSDGVHFERSPMYHARVAACARVARADRRARAVLDARRGPLRARVGARVHPDGEIALLNDAAFGVIAAPALLEPTCSSRDVLARGPSPRPASRSAQRATSARAPHGTPTWCATPRRSGRTISRATPTETCSRSSSRSPGQRVVVDAGVHGYDGDPLRAWCRSTRAHNTVEIDGEDQCEFWSTFRVARRAHPRDVVFAPRDDGFSLSAWHDGYQRLAGRPRHAREFRWYDDGVLLVRDRVRGGPRRDRGLASAPPPRLRDRGGRAARRSDPPPARRLRGGVSHGDGELTVEDSTYCPEFGRRFETRALASPRRAHAADFGFCIANTDSEIGYDLVSGADISGEQVPW